MTDTVSLTERIATRRRSRAVRWWVAGGALALVVGLAALAWFTPVLGLHSVSVTGATLSDPDTIEKSVMDQYRDVPLPQIRLRGLASQLERENPKARSIGVTWSGPRSLRVAVTDRQPRVAWKTTDGWVRYDADGRNLDTVKSDPGLPELVGSAHGTESIRAAVAVLNACSADQRKRVEDITAGDPERISLHYRAVTGRDTASPSASATPSQQTQRRVTIILGDRHDTSLKLRIAEQLANTGARTIDVSVPTRPVTR